MLWTAVKLLKIEGAEVFISQMVIEPVVWHTQLLCLKDHTVRELPAGYVCNYAEHSN